MSVAWKPGCRAERSLGREDSPSDAERGGWLHYDHHSPERRGYLAATRSRLIYHGRTTLSSLIMGLSLLLGVMAIAVLILGNNLMGWLVMAGIALMLWMLGKAVEAATAVTIEVEFDNVVRLESATQRMVAIARRDDVLMLHIDDPSDFRMVAALVSGLGSAAA